MVPDSEKDKWFQEKAALKEVKDDEGVLKKGNG